MKKLSLGIVTPEKIALEKEADFVTLPAFGGEMGILPGHADCAVQLSEGVLKHRLGEELGFFAVSGGFAEIHADVVSVFAEAAELSEEIDAERARQALQKAEDVLSRSGGDLDVDAASAAVRRAAARLKVVSYAKRKRPA